MKKIFLNRGMIILLSMMLIVCNMSFHVYGDDNETSTSGGLYETIALNGSCLNGNTIKGSGDTEPGCWYLDRDGGFYSSAHSTNGCLPDEGEITVGQVPYRFTWEGDTPYTGKDSIRFNGLETIGTEHTLTLNHYGVYDNVYVLGTAGGFESSSGSTHFLVTLNYADGTSETEEYELYDWYSNTYADGVTPYTGLLRYPAYTSGGHGPRMQSKGIKCDTSKLLKSITFRVDIDKSHNMQISKMHAAVYAVTGSVPAGVPEKPQAIEATDVTSTFTANWKAVSGATSYRLDVATDRLFRNTLDGYSNLDVGNVTSYQVTGTAADSGTYYYRIRAVNDYGQSLSSNTIATELPMWIRNSGLTAENAEYNPDTGTLTIKKDAVLTGAIILPEDDAAVICLENGAILQAPAGNPAVEGLGNNTSLTLTGTGTVKGADGTAGTDNGNGSPAIDFSRATGFSKIYIDGALTIQGGAGADSGDGNGGNGGDGIKGGSGLSIKIEGASQAAIICGGAGGKATDLNGSNGGIGGAGISGENKYVTIGGGTDKTAQVTGGDGGASTSGKGGTGGAAAEGISVSVNSGSSATAGTQGAGPNREVVTLEGATRQDGSYNGQPHKGYRGTVTVEDDKVSSDQLTYTYYKDSVSDGNRLSGEPKAAGSYKLVIAVPKSNLQYEGSLTIDFSIHKAELLIKAKDKIGIIGGAVPLIEEDDYTVTGLADGETLTKKPVLTYAHSPDMTCPGQVAIKPSNAAASDNYDINYEDGILTIAEAPVTLGKVEKFVKQVDPDAPDTSLDNDKNELADKLLDDAEKARLSRGENAKIWLEVKSLAEADVHEAVKTAIMEKVAEKLEGDIQLTYLELSMFKQIGNEDVKPVKQIENTKLQFTITLPEDICMDSGGKSRAVYLISSYDNGDGTEAEIIPLSTFDPVTGKLTFETDKFTFYALAYESDAQEEIIPDAGEKPAETPSKESTGAGGGGSENGSHATRTQGSLQVGDALSGGTLAETSDRRGATQVKPLVPDVDNSQGTDKSEAQLKDDSSKIPFYFIILFLVLCVILGATYKRLKAKTERK